MLPRRTSQILSRDPVIAHEARSGRHPECRPQRSSYRADIAITTRPREVIPPLWGQTAAGRQPSGEAMLNSSIRPLTACATGQSGRRGACGCASLPCSFIHRLADDTPGAAAVVTDMPLTPSERRSSRRETGIRASDPYIGKGGAEIFAATVRPSQADPGNRQSAGQTCSDLHSPGGTLGGTRTPKPSDP